MILYFVGNHWLGLEHIHRLTAEGNTELIMDVTTTVGQAASILYTSFAVDDESTSYKLSVGGYVANTLLGDILSYHNGWGFSTKDRDVDGSTKTNCAASNFGAWWYNSCLRCDLNGAYGNHFRTTTRQSKSAMRVRRTV